jgi:membrane-associated phospholipid phosphatase
MKNQMFRNSMLAIASLLILFVICYNWLDIPVAQWSQQHMQNGLLFELSLWMKKIFSPSIWLMIALFSLIIGCVMHYRKGRQNAAQPWLFFSIAYFFAFILGFMLKFILARYRPELFFESGLYGFHFFKIKDAFNSTPSGHVLANFAALYAIAKIVNRRWLTILLMLLATAIAISRIILTDHYLSDVVFGGYVGILSVYWTGYFFALKKNHNYR